MSESRDELYDGWVENARREMTVGSMWVQYPTLPVAHPNRFVFEVRGIVDDQVVYRVWSKSRGYFVHGMKSLLELGMNIDPTARQDGNATTQRAGGNWAAYGVPHDAL